VNAADNIQSPGAGTPSASSGPAAEAPVTGGLTYVFYHRDADGFGSALAAWCALGDRDVCYVSVQYDEPVPAVEDGARVYVVDFSFAAAVLREWAARGCAVVVIDHHQTAAEELAEFMGTGYTAQALLGEVVVVFDMTRAGCDLAWEWFGKLVHGEYWRQARPVPRKADGSEWPRTAGLLNEPLPWLLKAVADRDLWQFKHPDTKAICARLDLEKWDFPLWFSWCKVREEAPDVQAFIAEGRLLFKQQEQIARRQSKPWHWLELRGDARLMVSEKRLLVPAVNCSTLRDETAQALLERVNRELTERQSVVACYFRTKEGFKVSLRGDGTVDVAAIAQRYAGGGGHHSAAGFNYRCEAARLVQAPGLDGARMIAMERERQLEAEGYTPEHDAAHTRDEIPRMAMAYLLAGLGAEKSVTLEAWPFLPEEFNPSDWNVRNFVKAGALLAAEIDRLPGEDGL
jgi:hypothetical protein